MSSTQNVHEGVFGGGLRFRGAGAALELQPSDRVVDGEASLMPVDHPESLNEGRRSFVTIAEVHKGRTGRTVGHGLRSVFRSYNVDDWDDEDDPYDDEDEDDEEDEFFPDDEEDEEEDEEDEDVDEFDFDEDLDG